MSVAGEIGFEVVPTDRKADPRGALAELVRDVPGGAQLYVFTINPGQSRGGHWHRRKHEWFACVHGEATLVLEPGEAGPGGPGGGGRAEVVMGGDFSRVVRVRPGTRHTFASAAGATIVACISESFDPADPDTFFPAGPPPAP